MRSLKILGASALCLVLAALAVGRQANPAPPETGKAAAENPFRGKFVSVESYAPRPTTHLLRDVEIQKVGGETFLVGTSLYAEKDNWEGGARIWLVMRLAVEVIPFDSAEELWRRVGQGKPATAPAAKPASAPAAKPAGAAREAAIPKQVAAESFSLRSPEGREAGKLYVSRDGMPHLDLYDGRGKARAILHLSDDGSPHLFLNDGAGAPYATVGILKGIASLALSPGGRGGVVLAVAPDGTALVSAQAKDGSSRRAEIGVSATGEPRVAVIGRGEEVLFEAPKPRD